MLSAIRNARAGWRRHRRGPADARQNLRGSPTAADLTMIETAVVSYYNFLRVQGWIGNLALVFECEASGGQL